MEAACGVHDYRVRAAGFCCGHGFEDYRGGIGAGFLLDDFDAVALGPYLELFDGRGPEGVGGAENHAAAVLTEAVGELADAGGFTGTIYAHDENYTGIFAIGGAYQFWRIAVDIQGAEDVGLDFAF